MLIWIITALIFIACIIAWHLWNGISIGEVSTLFVASIIVFASNLEAIYDQATTDHYIVSGYVTSLVHHPSYSYTKNKSRHYVSEGWIIEQRQRPPSQKIHASNEIKDGVNADCYGECFFIYDEPPYQEHVALEQGESYAFPISVDKEKFDRTNVGEASVILKPYFNPVQASDQIIYNSDDNIIPYFSIDDYNHSHRLIAPQATATHVQLLENLNTVFSLYNISIGLIITEDTLYFEKLKRAWHQGKSNDFVIVVSAPDGVHIQNVNVLGWGNDVLKEDVSAAVMALKSINVEEMISTIDQALRQSYAFTPMDFSRYKFIDVKIPTKLYIKIIIFQIICFIYILLLLRFNPNTKDSKLAWPDVKQMWSKKFQPPNLNWHLHPFTPIGLCLYIGVPIAASIVLIR